jgi:CHAD domain-containing protein
VRILERSLRRFERRGRGLVHLDDHARHRVRIEAKKLRYAAEFFETLFPSRDAKQRRKAFGRAIEALLDSLGDLNDLTVVPALLKDLDLRQVRFRIHNRKRLLKKAERQYKTLLKITPFWQ